MPKIRKLNPHLVERFRMMEFLLKHYGRFNRLQIMDYFGISNPQVAKDIVMYHELHPLNFYFDVNKRYFVPTPTFQRYY